VMKNPYWAVSDATGSFKIPDPAYLDQHGIKGVPDLPPGKYVIKTWHEKLKTIKKVVEVSEKGETALRLNLTRGNPSVLYK